MKYAVIAISGSQFKVTEGQTITIDKSEVNKGETSSTDQVLLVVDEKKVEVGAPFVKGAKVEFIVENTYQGDKLDIFKYKSKSRYRRHLGYRAQLSDIKITKISL
jgi:large subunit ribosomal protein L21